MINTYDKNNSKPLVLVILDGFGLSGNLEGNAIKLAKTPNFDNLFKNYPWTNLKAAGTAVGLPIGQMGNSEVGHLNIGAGQIVYTGLSLINESIKSKTYFENPAFLKAINHAKINHSTLHLMGLLSPGGIHSLQDHLFLLIDLAHQKGLKDVTVHVFTDGRDVAPNSVKPWLKILMSKLEQYHFNLGSISGRLYGMDRDQNFDKTQIALDAICGHADQTFINPIDYIELEYSKGLTDEFIHPAINAKPGIKFLQDNDSVIFFNFRPDRARQLSHLLVGSNVYSYNLKHDFKNLELVTMMRYEGIEKADVAFDAMKIQNPLGKVLSEHHLTQLRVAETQKYAHVTFFFDGGVDFIYPNSDRILIDSPKVDNFALKPEMAAAGITKAIIDNLLKFDVIIANYANPDMVGHTGDLNATIKAIEIIDDQIGQLVSAVIKSNGTMFITADHGNSEVMLDQNHKPSTKHTSNDVPLICTDQKIKFSSNGKLANVSPTILDYLNITKPSSMLENSLLIKSQD